MYSDWRHVVVLALFSLAGLGEAQLSSNASTRSSLRVSDYADQFPSGTALPLYNLVWRAVGSSFVNPDGVNQTFVTDANNAFLATDHPMTNTVANIRNASVIKTTRKVNGVPVDQWVTDARNLEYSSMDLLMRTTFTLDSVWEDLGVTQQTQRTAWNSNLAARGWNMTAVVPMHIQIASEAANILQLMPLPSYSSYQVVIQVTGSNVVPSSLQMQNLITDTLLTLLASDHVFLIWLTEVDESVPQSSLTMTYIMQKSADTVAISTALELVLGRADTAGSQARSAFTAALAAGSINATALVTSETPFQGDSLQDQIYALTTATSKTNKHLGAIIGSSVGSGVALLVLLACSLVFGRGWLRKRRLQKQTAAWHKEQNEMGIMEDGAGTFHDSGSDLKTYSGGEGPAADESGAAKCWDIDAADIIMCKHPDGSDWLLSSSESGQVHKAIKGGVQDVVVKTSSTELAGQDMRKEVEVLKSVSYDRNVVQFYGTCPYGNQTMLVFEYMEGGDLRHALTNSSDGELKWHNKGATIALDIVRGIHFLHSHGVMHMDLKASNVFLTKTNSIAKIGEVDMAQVMGSSAPRRTHAATFAYSAPELILNGPCTEKVDAYSFGVILWELITSEVPRRGRLRAIKVPEECPAEVEQLIDLCLATDPADRPTAKQAFDIISTCSPPLAAPDPAPRQQAATSAATWMQAPAVQSADRNAALTSSLGTQSAQLDREQPLTNLQNGKHAQSGAANGNHHVSPDGMVLGQQLPSELGVRQPSWQQPSLLGHSVKRAHTADSQTTKHGNAEISSSQQQDIALTDNYPPPMYEQNLVSDSSQPLSNSLTGLQAAMPVGVFGHLYPSPFALAADDCSGPLWCWRNEQAAS